MKIIKEFFDNKKDNLLTLLNADTIPSHYISNIEIYNNVIDNYDAVEIGIGVARNEMVDYLTEINVFRLF